MKTLLLLLFSGVAIVLYSCNDNTYKPTSADSGGITDPERLAFLKDSLRQEIDIKISKSIIPDTAALAKAPVKIISAKVVQQEYSSYKNVHLEWKNVSGKTIDAVRFMWYGENAFGEAADMGGFQRGIGGGYTDDPLRNGKTEGGTWDVLSRDAKKIILAWPTEVVFSDGTKWKIENQ